eukprot:g1289.t1
MASTALDTVVVDAAPLLASSSSSSHSLPVPAATRDIRRWLVLAVYVYVGTMQGVVWITLNANPAEIESFFSLNRTMTKEQMSDTEDLFLNWGPIMYLPTVPWVIVAVSRGGRSVWATMLLCGVLTSAGALVRALPCLLPDRAGSSAVYLLHFGQALNGIAGAMVASTASAISAAWFEPRERTLATSIACLPGVAGPAIGFLISLAVISDRHIPALLFAELGVAIGGAVLWGLCPALPRVPPSASASRLRADGDGGGDGGGDGNVVNAGGDLECHRPPAKSGATNGEASNCASCCRDGRWLAPLKTMASDLRHSKLWTNASFILLLLSGGIVSGVFNCWSGNIPNSLQGQIDEELSKWLGFCANVANLVGLLLAEPLNDRLFKGRIKVVLIVLLGVSAVGFVVFALTLPLGPITTPIVKVPSAAQVVLIMLASLLLGATMPLQYELAAEVSFPSPEGTSGGLLSFVNNAGGLMLLAVSSKLGTWNTATMAITAVIGLVLLVPVRQRYMRREHDDSNKQ